MDDVWLSVMHSAMDTRTAGGPLVGPVADPEPSQPEGGSTSQPWRLFTVFQGRLWSLKMKTGAKVIKSNTTVTQMHSDSVWGFSLSLEETVWT